MEIEPSPPLVAKKLWNIVRIVCYMLKKGLSKNKLMLDLHVMLKRGKIASKNISEHMLHHHYSTTLSCGSTTDVSMSLIYPREYEFSCSNSPIYPSYKPKRKHHHHHRHRHHKSEDTNVVTAQKVFDILSNYEAHVEASPMINLPGFGRSPMVRQLRVTDSPFSIKDTEESNNNGQVDKAAEDFITKFYKELKQQKRIDQSPSRYLTWGRS